ncbi:MAG: DUF3179 domain-containing protein [Acidobacteria bacterium]|nr:DUF3179 domain-containing protein [Acidobacteriota bacterium]MCI0624868.1 DUF3179 domain-containing protein [Acidobacteriota bacterium]MCI0724417.1 DUF3179 domain-containing protein [Acidobacteriota bacterium]
MRHWKTLLCYCPLALVLSAGGYSQSSSPRIISKPNLHKSLTEPPCSYASTQHRKGLVRNDDRVIAWLRASHNGGAIPLRLFLSAPRVINDTYGLFFYDSDGDYVSAFPKDYGYEFYGWRNGVMVVKGKDGTLWSALSGRAFDGPQKGRQFQRIPSLMTDWGHWLMLHPESTAYDLYDGKKYPAAPLPTQMSPEAQQTMARVDGRIQATTPVLGVLVDTQAKAFPLEKLGERACFIDMVSSTPIAVFWYAPTRSAVAYSSLLDNRKLTFYADDISPETAPFKDKETGTRWTLAGRGVDGPLKGRELNWVNSVQCRWYAWSAEYPETAIYSTVSTNRK